MNSRQKQIAKSVKSPFRADLDAEKIKLPHLTSRTHHEKEQYTKYSYTEFADKVLRDNPNIEFSKQNVDEAFQKAAVKLGNSIGDRALFDQMVTRVGLLFERRGCADVLL